jgi:hypothetical protein
VENLLDEPGRDEAGDLLTDRLPLLVVEASEALLDGLDIWQDVQGILGDLPRDPHHVRGLP